MEDNERIQELEGDIFDLKSELRECIDRERIYQEILSEINDSIDNLFQREEENERFRFDSGRTVPYLWYRVYVGNPRQRPRT